MELKWSVYSTLNRRQQIARFSAVSTIVAERSFNFEGKRGTTQLGYQARPRLRRAQ